MPPLPDALPPLLCLQSAVSMGPSSAAAAGKAKARLQRLGSNMGEVGVKRTPVCCSHGCHAP